MTAVLKLEIPIDHERHRVNTQGGIVHIGFQKSGVVTIWFLESDNGENEWRSLQVYGTGFDVPALEGPYGYRTPQKYIGTSVDPVLGEVWHLFEAA